MATWTRESVIAEIVRREARNLPLSSSAENGQGALLYRAGVRLFGSWRNAVRAAGIAPSRADQRISWTPAKVIFAIRALARKRRTIGFNELYRQNSYMVLAARRFYGSWPKAVMAAGLDPLRFRQTNLWTKERILEAILKRALSNAPLGSHTVQPSGLSDAGAREFGSWRNALVAAGLDPERYINREHPWNDNEPTESGDDSMKSVDGKSESRAERYARIATCDLLARPGRGEVWTPTHIKHAIILRFREKKTINASAVHAQDRVLYAAALNHYSRWHKALSAVGLSSDESINAPDADATNG